MNVTGRSHLNPNPCELTNQPRLCIPTTPNRKYFNCVLCKRDFTSANRHNGRCSISHFGSGLQASSARYRDPRNHGSPCLQYDRRQQVREGQHAAYQCFQPRGGGFCQDFPQVA